MSPINMQTLTRPESTLYPLNVDEVDWFSGVASEGNQVLVIYHTSDIIIVILFTPDGLPTYLCGPPGVSIDEASGFFTIANDEVLHSWLRQIGFQSGRIEVKRFMLPQYHIGIMDLPHYYSDILLNPNLHSQDELEFTRLDVEQWSNQGLFVFLLNEFTDVWIDEIGAIVAT